MIIHIVNDSSNESHEAPVGPAFLLSQVGFHTAQTFADLLQPDSLSPQDAGILRYTGFSPGISQRELCARLNVLPSRLVVLLDSLEARNLISRSAHVSDRRTNSLSLTHLGQKALQTVGSRTKELEALLFRALSPDELSTLTRLLKLIVRDQDLLPAGHPAYRTLGE